MKKNLTLALLISVLISTTAFANPYGSMHNYGGAGIQQTLIRNQFEDARLEKQIDKMEKEREESKEEAKELEELIKNKSTKKEFIFNPTIAPDKIDFNENTVIEIKNK